MVLVAGLFLLGNRQMHGQAASATSAGNIPFKVVLDAGHGGHDPGNLGNGYLEKNIALNIVLEVGKVLEQEPNTEVIYTRRDDSFVDLFVRGEIANKAKADLFVSVHCDSHTSNAHGAGTFVLGLHANEQNFEIAKKENSVIYLEDNYETRYAEYDINSPESIIGLTIMQEEFLDQSILLGKLMQDRFTAKLGRNDRKVKQAGFIVLHQTFMPSVLVETGFLTNRDEGRYLNSDKGQQEMGRAIAAAILEYRDNIGGVTPPPISSRETLNTEVIPEPQETEIEKQPEPQISDSALESLPEPVAAEQPPTATEVTKPVEEAVKAVTKSETPAPSAQEPAKGEASNLIFKVQLMAVSRQPNLDSEDFKGLPNLSAERYNNMYRVLYGNTSSYAEAERLQSFAGQLGFTSSYIVAYRDGERVPLPEALSAPPN